MALLILAGCLSFHDLQEALQALQHKDNLLTDFVRMFIHDALVHSVRDMSYQNLFVFHVQHRQRRYICS